MDFRNRHEFSLLFAWIVEVFSWCFFATFFGSALSKKGRCCKVRHARILWFLQWILTIFKFYVFSGKGTKNRKSGQNFDAKNVANSGRKFLENPMQKIME